ncbi:MAG: 3-deoxy-manno-octulosonate cytidylyltransferase [Bacteroidetes bacterium]|nr:MAG: 3-deoxy-manno-octulosonate cytidylyltransferase [Bacteroidota bacterium]
MISMAKAICIIPARLESSRFPNKILTDIQGMPMFERVYHIAQVSGVFSTVFIASPNPEILELCEQRGIAAIATSFEHPCGSSRVFEAALGVDEDWDIVVNLQADQPFLPVFYLKTVVEAIDVNPVATIAYESEEVKDEHTVKVIRNKKGEGVYFSRYPIPYVVHSDSPVKKYCHLGLYAYKREFVLNYEGDFRSDLAIQESLEQLDFIHHGYAIDVALVPHAVPEVNTPEDLIIARNSGLL